MTISVIAGGLRRTLVAGIVAGGFLLAACGGGASSVSNGTSPSLPLLSSSVVYDGVKFSVPAGFALAQVGGNASATGGYMLKYHPGTAAGACTDSTSWQATSVFFTSADEIRAVSNRWSPSHLSRRVWIETGPMSEAGSACVYASQRLLLPKQGIGATISGQGVSSESAPTLARSIVASAHPVAESIQSGRAPRSNAPD